MRVLISLFVLLGLVTTAHAQSPTLSRVHRDLNAGPLTPVDSVRLIRVLSRYIPEALTPSQVREARFLRAMIASRLAATAALGGDRERLEDVATALRVPPSYVVEHLVDELDDVADGVYQEAALDASATLRFATGESTEPPTAGVAREIWLIDETLRRAQHEDPIPSLAEHGEDCVERCGPVLTRVPSSSGRRAIDALVRAWQAADAVERRAREGDEFALAYQNALPERRRALAQVELSVGALPEGEVDAASAGERNEGQAVRLSALLIVTSDAVRVGVFPSVRLDERGRPTLTQGEGVLPETRAIDAEADSLRRHIADVVRETDLPLAITALEGSSATDLRRVLVAVAEADVTPVFFGGAADSPVLVALRIQRSEAPFDPSAQYRVRVVQAGFALRAERGLEAIPRLGVGNTMRYDLARLERRVVRSGPVQSASLSFVPSADAGAIVAAALRLAPEGRALTLLVN